MTNPLIAKWEELYNPKEEPKKVEYELDPEFVKQLENKSTVPVNTPNITTKANNYISAKNASTSFKTYDPDSGENSFLQIVEKVKSKDAKVTSVTLNRDSVGLFTTGMTTITFEVQVWDTP